MTIQNKRSKQSSQIIIGSANIFVGTAISTILGGIRGVVIAGGLGPSLYGIWNIFMVISSYNSFIHLGLMDGMNKEMPYLRGEGNFTQAEIIKDNTFCAVLIISLCVNGLLILSCYLFEGYFQKGITTALAILAMTNVLFHIYCFLTSLLRTDKAFGVLSLSTIFLSLITFVFVLLFIKIFPNNLYGVLSALSLGYCFVIVYVFFRMKYKIKFALDLCLIKGLFKTGLPIIIIQIGYSLFISIDRWMVAGLMDQVNLGYYGIGFMMANFLYVGASTIAFILYPFMLEKFGQTNDAMQSEQLVSMPLIVLSYLMAVGCTFSAIIVPFLITYVLPAYIPGINAIIILIFGIYFICIMTIAGNFLVSVNKQNRMLYIQMLIIPLTIVLNYIFIKIGFGINGVAFGTAMANFVYGSSIILMAFRTFSKSFKESLVKIAKIYFPFIICIIAYFLLNLFFSRPTSIFKKDLFLTIVQILLFLGPSVFLAIHLNRITGVIHLFRDTIGKHLGTQKGNSSS